MTTQQKENKARVQRVGAAHWKIKELTMALGDLKGPDDWDALEETIRSCCKYDPDNNKTQAELADIYNLLDNVKDAWA